MKYLLSTNKVILILAHCFENLTIFEVFLEKTSKALLELLRKSIDEEGREDFLKKL